MDDCDGAMALCTVYRRLECMEFSSHTFAALLCLSHTMSTPCAKRQLIRTLLDMFESGIYPYRRNINMTTEQLLDVLHRVRESGVTIGAAGRCRGFTSYKSCERILKNDLSSLGTVIEQCRIMGTVNPVHLIHAVDDVYGYGGGGYWAMHLARGFAHAMSKNGIRVVESEEWWDFIRSSPGVEYALYELSLPRCWNGIGGLHDVLSRRARKIGRPIPDMADASILLCCQCHPDGAHNGGIRPDHIQRELYMTRASFGSP